MTSVKDVQDSLLARLKTAGVTGKFSVWEEAVPAGDGVPQENGTMLPYAIVSFGGQSPVAEWQQGIVSSAYELKWTSMAVECVAATPGGKRALAGVVRGLLEGYIPDPSWGQLREQLSDSYTVKVPDSTLWPVRFATGIVYNTQDNATVAFA
jgi:hypothetical protein